MNYYTSTSTKFFIRRTPVYAATLSALALTFQLGYMPVLAADATTTTTTDPTTTTTTEPTLDVANVLQSPMIDMFNSPEGLNINVDGISFDAISKLYFGDADVTGLVEQLISSELVQVSQEQNSFRLLVLTNEPILGEYKFGIEDYNGLLSSKKFSLEKPDANKANSCVKREGKNASGVYQYNPPRCEPYTLTISGCVYEQIGGGQSSLFYTTNGNMCSEITAKINPKKLKLAKNAPLKISVAKLTGSDDKTPFSNTYYTNSDNSGKYSYTIQLGRCQYGYKATVSSTEDTTPKPTIDKISCGTYGEYTQSFPRFIVDTNKRK